MKKMRSNYPVVLYPPVNFQLLYHFLSYHVTKGTIWTYEKE